MLKAPERAWVFEINAQGDTLEDALVMLEDFVRRIEEGSLSSVSGGYSMGGILTVRHNPDMTREGYHIELQKYLAARDAKEAKP
jgi:hypothetical protein